jgi:hypothetical protein
VAHTCHPSDGEKQEIAGSQFRLGWVESKTLSAKNWSKKGWKHDARNEPPAS